MLASAWGMGVDSTAKLVKCVKLGWRPNYILSADTGGEKPETYDYFGLFSEWLVKEGFPCPVMVRYEPQDFKHWPPYHTLEENCLTNGTLPSIAFGFKMKSCSQKWKQGPQHKFLSTLPEVQAMWKDGRKVKVFPDDQKIVKLIGYDNSPADRKRTYKVNDKLDKHYLYRYPLIEWGWDRERCAEEIKSVGLPVPLKSACFFCPASQTWEIRALPKHLLRRIVIMEARAEPRLQSIQGLWGTGRKGIRGGEKKPGSMTVFIRDEGLLPSHEITWLRENVPGEILNNQTRFARGESILSWPDFFADLEARAPWNGGRNGNRTTPLSRS